VSRTLGSDVNPDIPSEDDGSVEEVEAGLHWVGLMSIGWGWIDVDYRPPGSTM